MLGSWLEGIFASGRFFDDGAPLVLAPPVRDPLAPLPSALSRLPLGISQRGGG